MLADKAREKALLGAETKVYHGDRYVFPRLSIRECCRISRHVGLAKGVLGECWFADGVVGSCDRLLLLRRVMLRSRRGARLWMDEETGIVRRHIRDCD